MRLAPGLVPFVRAGACGLPEYACRDFAIAHGLLRPHSGLESAQADIGASSLPEDIRGCSLHFYCRALARRIERHKQYEHIRCGMVAARRDLAPLALRPRGAIHVPLRLPLDDTHHLTTLICFSILVTGY